MCFSIQLHHSKKPALAQMKVTNDFLKGQSNDFLKGRSIFQQKLLKENIHMKTLGIHLQNSHLVIFTNLSLLYLILTKPLHWKSHLHLGRSLKSQKISWFCPTTFIKVFIKDYIKVMFSLTMVEQTQLCAIKGSFGDISGSQEYST